MIDRLRMLRLAATVVSLFPLLVSAPARAADFVWNDEFGGSWDDPANWFLPAGGPPAIPQAGDTAFLIATYFDIVPVFYESAGNPELAGLYIDSNNRLFQSEIVDGDLTTQFEIVGWDGRGEPGGGGAPPEGAHVQRGSTNQVQNELTLGFENEGRGIYQLLETGILETGSTVIGKRGLGDFIQTGGSHDVAADLILGQEAPGTGTYELSGSLSVGGSTVIGDGGVGEMNGRGHTVGSNLVLGLQLDSDGTYRLVTGELDVAGASIIGGSGTGLFEQTTAASLHTIGGRLRLGSTESGDGTYRLTDGELVVARDAIIGGRGTGVFEQEAETSRHTVGDTLILGAADVFTPGSGDGTYRLSGGELHVGSELGSGAGVGTVVREDVVIVGQTTEAGQIGSGNFEQSGGTHFIGNPDRGDSEALLNVGPGSSYELSDGELVVYGSTTISPNGLNGSFLQTGGEHRVGVSRSTARPGPFDESAAGDLYLGRELGAHGQYFMQAGDLTISPAAFSDEWLFGGAVFVGQRFAGTGEFIQSGGNVVAHNVLVWAGSHYELSGSGSLEVKGGPGEVIGGLQAPVGGNSFIAEGGRFTQQGGQHTARRVIVKGGTYDLLDGSLNVNHAIEPTAPGATEESAINNEGIFNYAGGDLVLRRGTLVGDVFAESGIGEFTNEPGAQLNVSGSGTRVLDGDLYNADGIVMLTDTDLLVTGDYTARGSELGDGAVLELDPSSIRFEGDVTNEPGAYFVADAGSSFVMGADFINQTELNILWDTDEASLVFDGEGEIEHVFGLAGSDLGATFAGYVDNFAFGLLDLAEDDTLTLVDGNDTPGAALYIGILAQTVGLADITSPFNVYYDATLAENGWLGGQSFDLNGGGRLIGVIPEPGTGLLLGLGLAGLGCRRSR